MADRLENPIAGLLAQLVAGEPEAWHRFVDRYGVVVFQIVAALTFNQEDRSDCFVYACEQLNKDRYRRLRSFKVDGAASFETWLRAVTRNLCADWRRKHHGRFRTFAAIARLGPFDQLVFEAQRQGLEGEALLARVRATFPSASEPEVEAARVRAAEQMTSRHSWLLSTRETESVSVDDPESTVLQEIVDPGEGPQAGAERRELLASLGRALKTLSREQSLALRLRFTKQLTLAEISCVLQLRNAQAAERLIREALAVLREHMAPSRLGGKTRAVSV